MPSRSSRAIPWSACTSHPTTGSGRTDAIVRQVLEQVADASPRSNPGQRRAMHDGGGDRETDETAALPRIIAALVRSAGYGFVPCLRVWSRL